MHIKTLKNALKKASEAGFAWQGSVHWSIRGRETDQIGYVFYPWQPSKGTGVAGKLHLEYTTVRPSGERIPNAYTVELETTPCTFGGQRWWFRCPLLVGGKPCRRRCATLHLPPGALYFGCRQCYDLTYRSSQESRKWDSLYKTLGLTVEQGRELWKDP